MLSERSHGETPRPKVVVVVVAYNRQELLQDALDALAKQSRGVDAVVVVDNCSDDDSRVVAEEHPIVTEVLALSRNTGGAGGFAVGIACSIERHGADLVWLMDDDTIPTSTALAELLTARERYVGHVAILGSRVVWGDGRDHPMNTPRRRPGVSRSAMDAARRAGAFPVRSSSFVSMLVDADDVRRHGLPLADYFIWNDDFEYSCRILRRGVGLHVPGSVVEHRTKAFGATDADPGPRFYYEVRNKVWTFTRSSALSPVERCIYAGASLRRWYRTMVRSRSRAALLRAALRGLSDGLRTAPRSTSDVLVDLSEVAPDVAALDCARRG